MTFSPNDAFELAKQAYEAESNSDMAEALDYGGNEEPVETKDFVITFRDGEFGYEGGPRRIYYVLSFVNKETGHESFLELSTEYDSWNGTDWDYAHASWVKPKVVSVTEWVRA